MIQQLSGERRMMTMTQPPYRGPDAGIMWALLFSIPLYVAVAFALWRCT